jgi:formate-dependent nitrite reductase cytochrome c552 subunit
VGFKDWTHAKTGAPVLKAQHPEFEIWNQGILDFVESENSNGFHAPQEATRILGEAIDHFRKAQIALRPLPAETRR